MCNDSDDQSPWINSFDYSKISQSSTFLFSQFLLLAQVTLADTESEKLWEETLSMVREDFPRVQHISTDELAAILEGHTDFTLLDTREPEEYEVSHIQGAFLAEGVRDALKVLKDKSREDLVVVYCSVGYRSSNIAKKLARRGFTNVVNVEGSLFKWANETALYSAETKLSIKFTPMMKTGDVCSIKNFGRDQS